MASTTPAATLEAFRDEGHVENVLGEGGPGLYEEARVLLNELVVTGAYNYDEGGFEDAIVLLADGALPVDRLVEPEDAALEELEDTMLDLFEGRIGAKVLVAPST